MILLTRPFADSKALAKILKKKGHNCFIEPMLNITYQPPNLEEYLSKPPQSFIITSKHARSFVPAEVPLAAIPEQGAKASELAEWIRQNLKPESGKLVYLCGETVSFDMRSALAGFELDEIIVYRAAPPEDFSERLLKNFEKITLAVFFSRQTLRNFLTLTKKNQLTDKLQNIKLLCMSKNIAHVADNVQWQNINIAEAANTGSMVKKIDEIHQ